MGGLLFGGVKEVVYVSQIGAPLTLCSFLPSLLSCSCPKHTRSSFLPVLFITLTHAHPSLGGP